MEEEEEEERRTQGFSILVLAQEEKGNQLRCVFIVQTFCYLLCHSRSCGIRMLYMYLIFVGMHIIIIHVPTGENCGGA